MTHTDSARRKIFANAATVVASTAMTASSHFAMAAAHCAVNTDRKPEQQQGFMFAELEQVKTEVKGMLMFIDQAIDELDANGTTGTTDFLDLSGVIKKLDNGRHLDASSTYIGALEDSKTTLRATLLQMKKDINWEFDALTKIMTELKALPCSNIHHIRQAMTLVENRRKLWSYLETNIGDLMKVMCEFDAINDGRGSLFNFSSPALATAASSVIEGKVVAA